MRKLSDADSPQHAQRLVDGLLVEGIQAHARPAGGTEVWVVDERELSRARAYAATLSGNENENPSIARAAKKIRRDRDRAQVDHAQRFQDVRARWHGASVAGLGPVTILLIVGSVLIAVLGWLAPDDAAPMWSLTIDDFATTRPLDRIRQGEVWRLLTPMFLHFGVFHLVFNMLWVRALGPQIERGHGSATMAALVVVSEVVGNLGQYWASGPAFGGMSGVVYALFGFVWMTAQYDRRYNYAISGANTALIMGWFVVCATGLVGPIANIGHAGGLVVGLLFGLPAYVRYVRAKGTRPAITDGSWASIHLTGFRGIRRRYLAPYAPLWFLLLAACVIGAESVSKRPPAIDTGIASCDAYLERLRACPGTGPRIDVSATFEKWLQATGDPEALGQACEAWAAQQVCETSR